MSSSNPWEGHFDEVKHTGSAALSHFAGTSSPLLHFLNDIYLPGTPRRVTDVPSSYFRQIGDLDFPIRHSQYNSISSTLCAESGQDSFSDTEQTLEDGHSYESESPICSFSTPRQSQKGDWGSVDNQVRSINPQNDPSDFEAMDDLSQNPANSQKYYADLYIDLHGLTNGSYGDPPPSDPRYRRPSQAPRTISSPVVPSSSGGSYRQQAQYGYSNGHMDLQPDSSDNDYSPYINNGQQPVAPDIQAEGQEIRPNSAEAPHSVAHIHACQCCNKTFKNKGDLT
jgi:hypothetical protein